MNRDLKEAINGCADLVVQILEKAGQKDLEDTKSAIMFDMARFAMYLAASDGEIKWEEAKIISDYFDLSLTPQTVRDYIRRLNIYSTEFESTPPLTLQTLIAGDNLLYDNNLHGSLDTWGSEALLNTYKAIAVEIMNADGEQHENEVADATIYLQMMQEYIDNNLKARKASVKIEGKNRDGESSLNKTGAKGSNSAGTIPKTGVTAPTKS